VEARALGLRLGERRGGGKGYQRSIYGALVADLLIANSKFIAGFVSGSSAMLAEGAHSVADTVNQVFLLISLPLSQRSPDPEHPFGYGQERFFWSFIVAVGLFIAGAVFSFYEGVTKITGEAEGHGSYLIGYIVLGTAFVFESAALVVTIREVQKAARERDRSFWDHFKNTRNTTMKVPLYEDVAALVGLVIAAAGLLFTQLSGNTLYDGIASIDIGAVLSVVAFQLGADSRTLLLGAAAPQERQTARARDHRSLRGGQRDPPAAHNAFETECCARECRDPRRRRARHRPDRGAHRADNPRYTRQGA
jgi:cation diffusion facilitator family transporter